MLIKIFFIKLNLIITLTPFCEVPLYFFLPKTFELHDLQTPIKRHPCVPYCSPLLFLAIANHNSLHKNLSPQAGLLGMCRKLCSTFFHSEPLGCFEYVAQQLSFEKIEASFFIQCNSIS